MKKHFRGRNTLSTVFLLKSAGFETVPEETLAMKVPFFIGWRSFEQVTLWFEAQLEVLDLVGRKKQGRRPV